MRKDRLYLYTFLAISILFVIIGGISAKYYVALSAEQMLNTQLVSSKREAKEVASLIGDQFSNGIAKQEIKQNTQRSIQNTNDDNSFISILDWSGKIISHPDRTLVDTMLPQEASSGFTMNKEISAENFYELILNATPDQTDVLVLNPVPNSDWIIAAYANTGKISNEIKTVRNRFYVIFGIMGFVMVLTSVFTVRLIGSLYEKKLEIKNETLETEIINLAKLNSDLSDYQNRVNQDITQVQESLETEEQAKETNIIEDAVTEKSKMRILTYLRNELRSIATEEIAYIYTEHTITYVVDFQGKKSTTNSSLDELYSGLNDSYFYRANRQFIIAISAIQKIIRYGNNQLKIVVDPSSEIDIIIGKNKAAEFKQWLNL
ncbi:LytTR family transcriptional regulator [Maribacter sp. MJ134]|uniref:LytTR family transcriptional regulator n=1 Tax=Maribacter sp. MJ134 TaxID=2496865 RepID=UPI000F81CC13|nr:LytTR family transcriptional regulator [Maribacter sp. MJ134]AZQ58843.1 LytTR family transcriptional regulator [Maribacter sp. MJ134]